MTNKAMKRTPEERLWEWLLKKPDVGVVSGVFTVKRTPRQIYNYVTKYWEPKPLTKKKK